MEPVGGKPNHESGAAGSSPSGTPRLTPMDWGLFNSVDVGDWLRLHGNWIVKVERVRGEELRVRRWFVTRDRFASRRFTIRYPAIAQRLDGPPPRTSTRAAG